MYLEREGLSVQIRLLLRSHKQNGKEGGGKRKRRGVSARLDTSIPSPATAVPDGLPHYEHIVSSAHTRGVRCKEEEEVGGGAHLEHEQ